MQVHFPDLQLFGENAVLLAIAVYTVVDNVVAQLGQVLADLVPAAGEGISVNDGEACGRVAVSRQREFELPDWNKPGWMHPAGCPGRSLPGARKSPLPETIPAPKPCIVYAIRR